MVLQQWFDPARPGASVALMIEVVVVAQLRRVGATKMTEGSND